MSNSYEELQEETLRPCEIDGNEDFNCAECPAFHECQMILYDSYDEDGETAYEESDLKII